MRSDAHIASCRKSGRDTWVKYERGIHSPITHDDRCSGIYMQSAYNYYPNWPNSLFATHVRVIMWTMYALCSSSSLTRSAASRRSCGVSL